MRWVVGMDLRPLSRGALGFCGWLAGASRAAEGEEFHGVHVLEDDHLRAVLKLHHLDEVTEAARGAAARALQAAGLTGRSGTPLVTQAATAERGLAAAGAELGADALVIGRAAPTEGFSLVRLGRVARHLVRNPPMIVIVVPPDLAPEALGSGPVVALAGLSEGSDATCCFAAAFAARLGRTWVLAHVVPGPEGDGAHNLPPASVDEIGKARRREASAAAKAWVVTHGLAPAELVVLEGRPSERAAALAQERGAPLLVAGASTATGLEQAVFHSTVMELAASSPLPVAVVPHGPAA